MVWSSCGWTRYASNPNVDAFWALLSAVASPSSALDQLHCAIFLMTRGSGPWRRPPGGWSSCLLAIRARPGVLSSLLPVRPSPARPRTGGLGGGRTVVDRVVA